MKTLIQWSLGFALALPLAAAAAVSRPATPFTDAELDQLLAPVALYPDAVLSHVLIAATVPDEVEEAAEWSDRHPDLRGQEAVDAVERMDWDPSVKALVAFPDVLARMDEDPEWTQNLGEAFLDQEGAVMDRVQYLRDRADASGNLESVEHVRVVREREYIYLEPAVSHLVYVPYYDPGYVYGWWWWPSYPPHRWSYWAGYPVRYYRGSTFFWGAGFHLGPTYYWGRFNWPARHVVVTRPHRHYSPTPGYSGHSTVRREPHGTLRDRGRASPRSYERRGTKPARPGYPQHRSGGNRAEERRAAVVRESRPEQRRNPAEVQRELSARREQARSSPHARSDERHRVSRDSVRQYSQPAPREPSVRARERAQERVEVRRHEGAAPSPEVREQVRERGSAQSDAGPSRGQHESQRAPESRGHQRNAQPRQGRGRSER